MSFQTQSGPVLYSRGGALKSAFTWEERMAGPGAAEVAAQKRAADETNENREKVLNAFIVGMLPEG